MLQATKPILLYKQGYISGYWKILQWINKDKNSVEGT
jgi:hypothetical protein